MLLDFTNPFTMDVKFPDGTKKTFKTTFRDLTKSEKKEFEKKSKKIADKIKEGNSLSKKIERLEKKSLIKEKLEQWEEQEKIIDEIFELQDKLEPITLEVSENTNETLLKERFELCLGEKHKEEILELAETHGYSRVFSIIQQSISEELEGKSKE